MEAGDERAAPQDDRRGRRIRVVRDALALGVRPKRRIALLVATSLVTGAGEATLLFIIVRLASALASSENADARVRIGPVHLPEVAEGRLALIGAAILVLLLLSATVAAVVAADLAADTSRTARERVVSSFLFATWDHQATARPGRLQELASGHVSQTASAVQAITASVTAGVNLLVYTISALLLSPAAFALLLVGALVIGSVLTPLRAMARQAAKDNMQQSRVLNRYVSEVAATAREVNAFGVQDTVSERFRSFSTASARTLRRLRLLARLSPSIYQYLALALILLGLQAATQLSRTEITQTGAVVLLLVRGLSFSQQINTGLQNLNESSPFVSDLVATLDELDRNRMLRDGDDLPEAKELALESVEFAYGDGPLVLRDIDLTIGHGACIGVVGPSGGGKSTLLQVLLRLRYPTAGALLLSGRRSSDLSVRAWTKAVAFVPQDNLLISGTVAENVSFFRDIDRDAVIAATKDAHLHDEVIALPDGYDTVLGRGGFDLSGGQRQRVGLARALAGGPDVIVLDEPTSALDMHSEHLVQQTLLELKGRVTLVIVAHRMSTMTICDRIIVLQAGQVVADGRPDDVESANEFYPEAMRLTAAVGAPLAPSPDQPATPR